MSHAAYQLQSLNWSDTLTKRQRSQVAQRCRHQCAAFCHERSAATGGAPKLPRCCPDEVLNV